MAKVKISDVIEPSIFADYVIERTAEKSRLFQSNLISQDERIQAAIGSGDGGRTIDMPFWNDLSGSSQILSDSTSLTTAKMTASQDAARLHLRGAAWSENDLAGLVAGDDPMAAIGSRVADYWNRDMQAILISTLKGILNETNGVLYATHVNDIADDDPLGAGTPAPFTDDAFLDAVFLLGDEQEAFQAIAVHSTVQKTMLKADLISTYVPSEGAESVQLYRGRRVIVDDSLPKIAGPTSGFHYWSYIFGPGAIGYGEGRPSVPVETDRDSLAGDDFLINRRHFVFHPRGVRWTGSPAGAAPTNAELELGTNWSKVYGDKNIRIGALVTNS